MGCATGCRIEPTPLYLQHRRAAWASRRRQAGRRALTTYVSDPAKPVPYLPRPIHIDGEAGERRWQPWLVSDQREASSRPDVLSFTSEILRDPVKISGEPIANLVASTTGTDGDFVVKLIDVYPEERRP